MLLLKLFRLFFYINIYKIIENKTKWCQIAFCMHDINIHPHLKYK